MSRPPPLCSCWFSLILSPTLYSATVFSGQQDESGREREKEDLSGAQNIINSISFYFLRRVVIFYNTGHYISRYAAANSTADVFLHSVSFSFFLPVLLNRGACVVVFLLDVSFPSGIVKRDKVTFSHAYVDEKSQSRACLRRREWQISGKTIGDMFSE